MEDRQKNTEHGQTSILVLSASLRNDSYNTRLAKLAALVVEKNGGKVDFADMNDFDCLSFNQDLEVDNYAEAFLAH